MTDWHGKRLSCPDCGYSQVREGGTQYLPGERTYPTCVDDFDVCGACDGCVICPQCACAIEIKTGKVHEPCDQCIDIVGVPVQEPHLF